MASFRNLLGLPVKGWDARQDGQVLVPKGGDHWEFSTPPVAAHVSNADGTSLSTLSASVDALRDALVTAGLMGP